MRPFLIVVQIGVTKIRHNSKLDGFFPALSFIRLASTPNTAPNPVLAGKEINQYYLLFILFKTLR